MLSHYHNMWFYHVIPPVSFISKTMDDAKLVKHDEKSLKHIIGLRGVFEIDMWIPSDMDAEWAFNQVFSSYGRKNGGR